MSRRRIENLVNLGSLFQGCFMVRSRSSKCRRMSRPSAIIPIHESRHGRRKTPSREDARGESAGTGMVPVGRRAVARGTDVRIIRPEICSRIRGVTSGLLGGRTMLLGFGEVSTRRAGQVISFLAKAMCTVKKRVRHINSRVFLYAPTSIKIRNTLTRALRRRHSFC